MTHELVNGVNLYYEASGQSDIPLILVHGSWVSHSNWDQVAPQLAETFRVVTYDRRGHSDSGSSATPDSVHDDVTDLAALIEHLGIAPAYVGGNSFGASIALRLAVSRPGIVRGVIAHEPPLFGLLGDDPELAVVLREVGDRIGAVVERIRTGDHAGAAEQFIETVALGPGMWSQLPNEFRQTLVRNAPTYLDECTDPDQLAFDVDAIGSFAGPVLLTLGDQSPPAFAPVVRLLAAALSRPEVLTFAGAGHIPHVTHPAYYVEATKSFILKHEILPYRNERGGAGSVSLSG